MRFGFTLRHGWSFAAGDLRELGDALRSLTPHVQIDDLGYWHAKPTIAPRETDIAWIAVGHSLGFASLVGEHVTPWIAAVSIGGFYEFENPGLATMRAAFAAEPRRVLHAFRRNCDLASKYELPTLHPDGIPRLQNDLQLLSRLRLAEPEFPVLSLHGKRDRIVHPWSTSIVEEQAGHNLGIEHVEFCRMQIVTFTQACLAARSSLS